MRWLMIMAMGLVLVGCGQERIGFHVVDDRGDELMVGWTSTCGVDTDTDDVEAREEADEIVVRIEGASREAGYGGGCTDELRTACVVIKLDAPRGNRPIRGKRDDEHEELLDRMCRSSEREPRRIEAS